MNKLKRMCECCQNTYKTKEHVFTDGNSIWCRDWCRKCLYAWRKRVSHATGVTAEEMSNQYTSWFSRLVLKLEKWRIL